jgi:superfamily I DNA and RNA helicase
MSREKNDTNHNIVDEIIKHTETHSSQAYIIDRPLGDNKYSYDYSEAFVLLMPKFKIMFFTFTTEEDQEFQSFRDDFLEDLGSIADKYRYRDIIGRPRSWADLVATVPIDPSDFNLVEILEKNKIVGDSKQKVCELLISLLTGSINDIDKVKSSIPDNILDKVKQKILLFDGDQTRFVYQRNNKKTIRIQGLSGTGKTELLLHKLKELYINSESNKIFFTCHNKILADNLKKRIPEFFNFMKVEQQIEWDERLWCTNAWGSGGIKNSGAYAFICAHYGLTFHSFGNMNFDYACKYALKQLNEIAVSAPIKPVFDYMLVDESQDFPQSFFDLCERVTQHTVYIAGDIFQSIFATEIISNITPDFLLSKCYRTDPRTLMFAHSLGMGLFEQQKLQWLEDDEWRACGYIVEKSAGESLYRLKRESLRRFEDLANEDINSTVLVLTNEEQDKDTETQIIQCIRSIKSSNPTVLAEDIGIIFLENKNTSFQMADRLERSIPQNFGWTVNKAYETKKKIKDRLFISHRNHVKGLEFPFVICVAGIISSAYGIRNSLYMMITRSFLQTYLIMPSEYNQELYDQINTGLEIINAKNCIEVLAPTKEEIVKIRTTITHSKADISFYDFVYQIFDELAIYPLFRSDLYETVKRTVGEKFARDNVREVIEFNYKIMLREQAQ